MLGVYAEPRTPRYHAIQQYCIPFPDSNNSRSGYTHIVGEKRTLERFILKVPARIRFCDAAGVIHIIDAVTRDISAEGAYFRSEPAGLPVGAGVEVELVLNFEGLREVLGATDRVTANVDGSVLRQEMQGVVVVFNHPFRFSPERPGQDSPAPRPLPA